MLIGGMRIERNDACPCKSGKKFKKCCMPKMQGFINTDEGWVSKNAINKQISEKHRSLPPVNSQWNMK